MKNVSERAEQLNGQQNAKKETGNKENSSNEELIKRTPIPHTHFEAVTADGKHFGIWGRVRITDYLKSEAEVIKKLSKFNWEVVLAVVIQVTEDIVQGKIQTLERVAKLAGRTIDDISTGGSAKIVLEEQEENTEQTKKS